MRISYKSGMIRLNDSQWERIRDHFPEENIPDGRAGRKPTATRQVLEAVLWILNTGAQWPMLPQCYPNYKTVHRRFQAWCHNEVLRRVLMDIANELRERGLLDQEECFIDAKPDNLVGDRAYDSDQLDESLRRDGIEMIAPHRSNRTRPPTQDRRRLRRYARRWLVERFFAWIQWQRRILVRWEYYPQNFLGFVQLACLVVLFRRF